MCACGSVENDRRRPPALRALSQATFQRCIGSVGIISYAHGFRSFPARPYFSRGSNAYRFQEPFHYRLCAPRRSPGPLSSERNKSWSRKRFARWWVFKNSLDENNVFILANTEFMQN